MSCFQPCYQQSLSHDEFHDVLDVCITVISVYMYVCWWIRDSSNSSSILFIKLFMYCYVLF